MPSIDLVPGPEIDTHIYTLVHQRNTAALKQLQELGISLTGYTYDSNPLRLLSENAHTIPDALYLIQDFKLSIYGLLLGLGTGGHEEVALLQINQEEDLNKRKKFIEIFVMGLGAGGHFGPAFRLINDAQLTAAERLSRLGRFICGLGYAGFFEEANTLLAIELATNPHHRKIIINWYIKGLSLGGKLAQAMILIAQQSPEYKNLLIRQLIKNLNYSKTPYNVIINLIKSQANADFQKQLRRDLLVSLLDNLNEIVMFIRSAPFPEQKELREYCINLLKEQHYFTKSIEITLRQLISIDDLELKWMFAEKFVKLNPETTTVPKLLKSAKYISNCMKRFHLTFTEALALRNNWKAFVNLFLLLEKNTLPPEMFCHIAANMLGLPEQETFPIVRKVVATLHEEFSQNVKKKHYYNFKAGLYPIVELEKHIREEDTERYWKRSRWL